MQIAASGNNNNKQLSTVLLIALVLQYISILTKLFRATTQIRPIRKLDIHLTHEIQESAF